MFGFGYPVEARFAVGDKVEVKWIADQWHFAEVVEVKPADFGSSWTYVLTIPSIGGGPYRMAERYLRPLPSSAANRKTCARCGGPMYEGILTGRECAKRCGG